MTLSNCDFIFVGHVPRSASLYRRSQLSQGAVREGYFFVAGEVVDTDWGVKQGVEIRGGEGELV